MKKIVVVESPSKTKKLASFLGKDFEVTSSVGHIRDLPKSGLAVDVEKNFEPEYVITKEKADVAKTLKKLAKEADEIYLATDLDREGEAIAWHVAYIMNNEKDLEDDNALNADYQVATGIKNKEGENPKVYRATFTSITKDAVLDAFKSPRKLDFDLINAQQGRRVLDRLVGYKLSPLLWEKIRYGLSAGRVQSVAVRLVVEREREIESFSKLPYWEVAVEAAPLNQPKEDFVAKLISIDEAPIYEKHKFELFASEYTASKTNIDSKEKLDELIKDLDSSKYVVSDIQKKEAKSHPSPPFTTSTLQQAASSVLGISPRRTMQLAQKLYEGGYITYMRTDSIQIASPVVNDLRKFVGKVYGDDYLLPKERHFAGKKGLKTQEAHEAIRPTDFAKGVDDLPKSVVSQQRKLYDLIWRRTVATQMKAAVYDNTKVLISAKGKSNKNYQFEVKGSIIKFDGHLKVSFTSKKDEILPDMKVGEDIEVKKLTHEEKEMSPPPRYNESSLVRDLEKFNIGRPSTYASIIATIQTRGYVRKDGRNLFPTDNGFVVNDLLAKHFPQIVDVDFTAEMEESLDLVAEGKEDWHEIVRDFYTPFEKLLIEKKKEIKKEDITILEKTDETCPECKEGKLVVKLGKYGKFYSCDKFPDCKYGRPYENGDESGNGEDGGANELDDETKKLMESPCPEDGGKLMVKVGRFGRFVACENYPKCKFTQAIKNKIGMKCPECGEKDKGEVIMRKTKKGRTFYGCSRYPKCEYASWTRPTTD